MSPESGSRRQPPAKELIILTQSKRPARFEPERLGKLDVDLEALDRDVKKPHENPAIGLLLCASKDSEVGEYALSRTPSPALAAQYETQLPDKRSLAAKLHEFCALNAPDGMTAKPVSRTRKPKGGGK